MMLYPSGPEAATRFLSFVNASPTPFHAVHNAALRLEKAGFRKVNKFVLLSQSANNATTDQREGRLGKGGETGRQILFHQKPGLSRGIYAPPEVETRSGS
jgi:hypothetical protein